MWIARIKANTKNCRMVGLRWQTSPPWAGRFGRKRWRVTLPAWLDQRLRLVPWLLLVVVICTVMLQLPMDLADLELFDAFLFCGAGWSTITLALGGLLASLILPQPYCKYGCPTGALLEFARSHGESDSFGKRDLAAALLVLLALTLAWNYDAYLIWLNRPNGS